MRIEAKIVGFDKISERLAFEAGLPGRVLETVKAIACVPESDPDLVGSYPLDGRQVASIAAAAQVSLDPGRFDYFLEADEEEHDAG